MADDASLEDILDVVLPRLKVERSKRQIEQGQAGKAELTGTPRTDRRSDFGRSADLPTMSSTRTGRQE